MGGPTRFPTLPLVALALVAAIAVIMLLTSASGAAPSDPEGSWDLPEWPTLPSPSVDVE